MIEQIGQILHSTGLDAGTLILEITENAIVENGDKVTAAILQLREMGIELSIDDFGTGYSSLGGLYNFPISVLKIDRSFISLMGTNSKNLEIIEKNCQLVPQARCGCACRRGRDKRATITSKKVKVSIWPGTFFLSSVK